MGKMVFLVEYKACALNRNSDVLEILEKHMPRNDDNGHYVIDTDTFEDFIKDEMPSFATDYPESTEAIRKMLEAEHGTIELYIGG